MGEVNARNGYTICEIKLKVKFILPRLLCKSMNQSKPSKQKISETLEENCWERITRISKRDLVNLIYERMDEQGNWDDTLKIVRQGNSWYYYFTC